MQQYHKDLGKAFAVKIILLICLGVVFWGYKKYYPRASIDIKKIYISGNTDGSKRS